MPHPHSFQPNAISSRPSHPQQGRALALLRPFCLAAVCGSVIALTAPVTAAGDNPVFIQWFETSWTNIENRMPDAFMSGYAATWIPPVWKASYGSAGYDCFDRFDLGSPDSPTMYGTEAHFRQMVMEFHKAGIDVYVDLIMNHNSSRTTNSAFLADGGWPGFYLPASGPNFWGDFHDGTKQSQDPNSGNYDLWTGDLVSLIDISHESNFQYIRHPVTSGASNLPPGNIRNQPNPANARFYPDPTLTPLNFVNPANGQAWSIKPFNNANPSAGVPYAENATGMLTRSVQWMLDEFKVDGFRLDAAKHIPQWFWNNYFDSAMYQRRVLPNGTRANPYSFGEIVDSNSFIQTYIRKDGFANRDALDISEAGGLRDILNARGFGTWQDVLNRSVDNQDNGANDGSQGVHHIFSHDNGSAGNGGSAPPLPTISQQGLVENCYLLFRAGGPIVYHNSREMATRFGSRGFWPREGNPSALGNTDTNITRLVQLHNGYARGGFYVLNSTDPVNQSLSDVLVFERSNGVAANVLAAVNDRYDNGTQARSVQTTFPAGTRLRELSGVAADPVANLGGAVQQVLTVDANRRVLVTVPNNTNSGGVQHHRGYVVYGPAAPTAAISITSPSSTLPADDASVPTFKRRLTPVDVVNTTTFEIRIDTTKTDPLDSEFDDFAAFRIDQGWVDYNASGGVDITTGTVDAGFETFQTQFSPISGPSGTGATGVYRQSINTAQLSEGLHYITANVYRRRTDGGLPIFAEVRKVIYVDRSPPQTTLLDAAAPVGGGNFEFRVQAADGTTNRIYIVPNVPSNLTPAQVVATYAVPSNQAYQYDRREWRRNVGNLPAGNNSLTVIAFEPTGNFAVSRYENIQVTVGSGDVNLDGFVNLDDLYASWVLSTYRAEADLNHNSLLDVTDRKLLENLLRPSEGIRMRGGQR
ncbi:MAG: alpha-amylase family glycosyl hydrolase [Phycisphaerales bacterium]